MESNTKSEVRTVGAASQVRQLGVRGHAFHRREGTALRAVDGGSYCRPESSMLISQDVLEETAGVLKALAQLD